MNNKKATLGIIGGMGPLATADLFRKIVENTPASCDQDHPRILIDCNTNIPDRTAALLDGGASPVSEMVKSAVYLEQGGADCLMMPCNTAHGFLDAVKGAVGIPVLNMIRLTHDELARQGVKKAGLLATTGTIRTGIYQKYFDAVELLLPDEEEQQAVMHMIYSGVKAGVMDYDARRVQEIARGLLDHGAQCIILGCTELPLAMSLYGLDFPSIDPTLELAKGAVRFCADNAGKQ